jgi:flavin-binding protein dodecin
MSVARVTEITASSSKSFDGALRAGLARANKSLENVNGAWIKDQEVVAHDGKVTEYRLHEDHLCAQGLITRARTS